jgi:hypothetical protein
MPSSFQPHLPQVLLDLNRFRLLLIMEANSFANLRTLPDGPVPLGQNIEFQAKPLTNIPTPQ